MTVKITRKEFDKYVLVQRCIEENLYDHPDYFENGVNPWCMFKPYDDFLRGREIEGDDKYLGLIARFNEWLSYIRDLCYTMIRNPESEEIISLWNVIQDCGEGVQEWLQEHFEEEDLVM